MRRLTATALARNLSQVLDELARGGDEVLIERNQRPIARLIPGPARQTALEALSGLYRTCPSQTPPGRWICDMYGARAAAVRCAIPGADVAFLLDTCVWVDVERGRLASGDVGSLIRGDAVYLSPVVLAELRFGAKIASEPAARQRRTAALARLAHVPVLPQARPVFAGGSAPTLPLVAPLGRSGIGRVGQQASITYRQRNGTWKGPHFSTSILPRQSQLGCCREWTLKPARLLACSRPNSALLDETTPTGSKTYGWPAKPFSMATGS